MSDKTAFTYEMMSTVNLAAECHRLKAMIDEEARLLNLGVGDVNSKRHLQAQLKKAKAILKNRQMRLF